MMKSLADKDDPIETIAARCLGLLHKHNMGCGVTLVPWIQSTCKGGRYRISVVNPLGHTTQMAQAAASRNR
jgi:hypothetical protein